MDVDETTISDIALGKRRGCTTAVVVAPEDGLVVVESKVKGCSREWMMLYD